MKVPYGVSNFTLCHLHIVICYHKLESEIHSIIALERLNKFLIITPDIIGRVDSSHAH